MTEGANAVNEILKTIDLIVAKRLELASFDITKRGIVKETLGENLYRVGIEGAAYVVPSSSTENYNNHDIVYVLYPQGNGNDKVIVGKVR